MTGKLFVKWIAVSSFLEVRVVKTKTKCIILWNNGPSDLGGIHTAGRDKYLHLPRSQISKCLILRFEYAHALFIFRVLCVSIYIVYYEP